MTVSATVRQSSGLVPLLGRILGSGLLAAAVALVSWFVLARTSLPAFSNSNATKALASAGTALVFLVLAIVVYFMLHPKAPREGSRLAAARVWHVLGVLICWLAPAALVVAVLGIPLAATRLYLDGISVDQAFRTQFLTKMAADPGYSDMAYLDMPSFYPRLWFITGGLFAQVVGLAGWAAFQPWALVTLAATASVLVPVWQRITGSLPLGSVIATVTTIVVLYTAPEEPYAAIVALGMPAAAVLAGRAVRGSWPAMTGLVIYLGLSANLYTLHTAIAALSAVLIAFVVAWKGRRTRVEGIAGGAAYRPWQPLARLAIIGIGSIAIALVGWAPYLFQLFSSEHGSTGRAQHYLPESGTEIPTPFFDFSIVGVLALVCVVWIALKSQDRIAQYLLAGLVVSYGWILLSMIAPVAGTTLLGFRVELPVTLYLVTGGVLALAHVRRTGFATVYPAFVTPTLAPKITLLLGVVLAFATASYAVSVPLHLRNEIDLAYTDTDGDASRGDTLPADSTVYFADVDAAIRQLRGDDNRQNTVVLTDEQGFMAYNSYPVFQAISAHYANPLGQYEKRNAEIEHWTTIEDPDELRAAMDASARDNGWRTPDVLLLRGQLDEKGTGDIDSFSYRISEDIYPNDPNVRFRPVSFHAAAFSSGWVLRQIGPFVLAVRE